MKAVNNERSQLFWATVKNGCLNVWDGEKNLTFREITGQITGVKFKQDSYQGIDYDVALFELSYLEERWVMSVKVDSYYFRSLCSYLMTAWTEGKLLEPLIFSPYQSDKDGRKVSSIFVKDPQKNWFKSIAVTDQAIKIKLPQPITYQTGENKIVYDWTPLNQFYKAWLTSTIETLLKEKNTDLPF